MHQKNSGFTLIEMMVTVAVAAILLTIAIPSFTHMIEQNRLKSTAETLYADLRFARSEAIKRNRTVRVSFYVNGSDWCYGLKVDVNCDCTGTNPNKPCEIAGVEKVVNSDEFTSISITDTASSFSFSPLRGTADPGSTKFQSANNKKLHVVVSGLGRVRLCSPSGAGKVSGYPAC